MSTRRANPGYALTPMEEAALDFKVWSQIKLVKSGCDVEFLSRLDRSTKDWTCFYYNEENMPHSAMAPQKGQIVAAVDRLVLGKFITLVKGTGAIKKYKVAKDMVDPREIEEDKVRTDIPAELSFNASTNLYLLRWFFTVGGIRYRNG